MNYSTIEFVFYFLLVLIIFTFITRKIKIPFLMAASSIWIFSWKMQWMFIYLAISLFNYFALYVFDKFKVIGQKKQYDYFFVLILTINTFIYISLKSGLFLGEGFETPYGLSFFMFILVGYLVDLWRAQDKFQLEKMSHFLLLPSFFPALMGGPIIRGKDFFTQLNKLSDFSLINFIDGMMIFGYGFCKFYFISKELSSLVEYITHPFAQNHFLVLVIVGFLGTVQAYIDFSSYCDMGRGVAKCLGINLNANFRAFYYAQNPNDFWQRWNISLGTWIRDYISFPLMLRWGRRINQSLILLFSFVLVGVWHGLELHWLLFGLLNGALIVLYNFIIKKWSVPYLGKFFVFFIFIGNGLLQKSNLIPSFNKLFEYSFLWKADEVPWRLIFSHGSSQLVWSIFILVVLEFFQEKHKDVDWFTKKNLVLKAFVVLSFFIWILYGLNSHQFLNDVKLPPVYFRI